MNRIASFHLLRWSPLLAGRALAGAVIDRRQLAGTTGLAFWRSLGTGRGRDTAPGADLRRSAAFAVWEDESSLDQFLAQSAIAARWRHAEESFHVRLRGIAGHGSWSGTDVVGTLRPGSHEGPVAVLTHATVRVSRWRRFGAAGRPVSDELREASGLLAVCGIGEAPRGRLGTFSIWRSAADVDAFSAHAPAHRSTVARTLREGWYSESVFARFEPYSATGTWDGLGVLQ